MSPVTGTDNARNTLRSRSVVLVVVLGLAGALVGVVPDGVSAVPARSRCRPTAFVANANSDTVSPVGAFPNYVAVTPDGKTALVINGIGTVSTIDVKSRTKDPADITVGSFPLGVAVTPDGRAAFIANSASDSVSTIDVRTRTK